MPTDDNVSLNNKHNTRRKSSRKCVKNRIRSLNAMQLSVNINKVSSHLAAIRKELHGIISIFAIVYMLALTISRG